MYAISSKLYRLTAETYLADQQQVQTSPKTIKFALKDSVQVLSGKFIIAKAAQIGLSPALLQSNFAFAAAAGW